MLFFAPLLLACPSFCLLAALAVLLDLTALLHRFAALGLHALLPSPRSEQAALLRAPGFFLKLHTCALSPQLLDFALELGLDRFDLRMLHTLHYPLPVRALILFIAFHELEHAIRGVEQIAGRAARVQTERTGRRAQVPAHLRVLLIQQREVPAQHLSVLAPPLRRVSRVQHISRDQFELATVAERALSDE